MSQGTGRPEEKEGDGGLLVSGTVKTHTFIKIPVLLGLFVAPKQL